MKSIIITGASRGIGASTALLLAEKYDYMAICSHSSPDALNAIKAEVEKKNCICRAFTGDVSDYSFAADLVSNVIKDAGHIDVLINNAAISTVGLFTDMKPEEWHRIIDINLNSLYNMCHNVVPHMVHEHSGRIINISSVWGFVGASCEVAYSATKGAVNSFSRALAKELAPSHISVNAIAFGAVDTSMNSHLSEDELNALCEEIPYGKMATSEEAAMCIGHVIDMPSYLTGEVIKFDGAWI